MEDHLLEKEEVHTRQLSLKNLLGLSAFWFGYQLMWTTLSVELLPGQVEALGGKEQSGTNLGAIYSGGAVISLASPIIGHYSDHCGFKYGKRRIYMLIGTLFATLFLLGVAFSKALWTLCIFFLIFDFFAVMSSAPFNGLVGDITPESQRGSVSGVVAAMGLLGNVVGAGLGVLYGIEGDAITVFTIAALYLTASMCTIFTTGEERHIEKRTRRHSHCVELKMMFMGLFEPFKHNDFRWVFFTRLLMEMGVYTLQENLLYFVQQDYVKKIDNWNAKISLVACMIPLLVAGGVSSFVIGRYSDYTGKRKIFVYIAGALMAGSSVLFAFVRDLKYLMPISGMFGMGFGSYYAVDYALALDVIPNKEEAGKDLNVWYMALVIPQVLAVPIGGAIIRSMNYSSLGFTVLMLVTAFYCFLSAILIRFVRNVK